MEQVDLLAPGQEEGTTREVFPKRGGLGIQDLLPLMSLYCWGYAIFCPRFCQTLTYAAGKMGVVPHLFPHPR